MSSSCTAFSQKTRHLIWKRNRTEMFEVPLKHFQRHFHKYILQMYITPQSSLKPIHGITESYCWWCYIVTKAHIFIYFFIQLASYCRWDTCISGYLFYIICSKWFLPRNPTNITKMIIKIMKVSNLEIN